MRIMRYANQTSFPFKILIADGGQDEHLEEVLSANSNFPNLDYKYCRYPYDKTYEEYYAKTADAIGKVETPFCVLADDDNFFSIDGLRRAVDFLGTHPDYSACQGYTTGFRLEPRGAYYYGRRVSYSAPLRPHYSLDGKLATDRLKTVSGKNFAMCYAVQHTGILKEIFDKIVEANFHDLYMMEIFFNFLTVASGKVQQDQYPYLYRQFDTYNSSCEQASLVTDEFDRMLWPTFSEEFSKFVNLVSETVSNKDNCSVEEARSIVKICFRTLASPTIMACLNQNRIKQSVASSVKRSPIVAKIGRSIKLLLTRMPIREKISFYKEKEFLTGFLTTKQS